jgi:Mg-chelatase subunit ChlD
MQSIQRIPIQTKEKGNVVPNDTTSPDASLTLHPLQSQESLLIKIQPPTQPQRQVNHVAVDIVLVIDVSGSMNARADVPGEDPNESPGLSVLDLVKHATTTIIEALDEGDRLGIVTFCSKSNVVQELTVMTDEDKELTRERVKKIVPLDSTNMWHGMLDGLKLFQGGGVSERVPSMMVLTDGMPNHM